MRYFCCDELRRTAVARHSSLNGIEYLEVLDDPSLPDSQRQRTLSLHFIKTISGTLTRDNIHIDGGQRVRDIKVVDVNPAGPDMLQVEVEQPGDFSIYTLRLVVDQKDDSPPSGYDPLLSVVDFSFKVACPSDFDCKGARVCPPEVAEEPLIDYLAKDYASFRKLVLDRFSLLMPGWKGTHSADLGITLVELLAYMGDYFSYRQDAVATEAYLGTARRRISVRRHARLVDYHMHDGCNARVWVQVAAKADRVQLPVKTQLFTVVDGIEKIIPPNSTALDQALEQGPEVFETMHPAVLYKDHNAMLFYTWGDRNCCLPKGATQATLNGKFPNLLAGDVLIFYQQVDPKTGLKEDADIRHRHAVRLTHVQVIEDPLGGQLVASDPDDQPRLVTQIEWAQEDALPMPFCVSSSFTDQTGEEEQFWDDISVALGNIVLADHGMTLPVLDALGAVPAPRLRYPMPVDGSSDHCRATNPQEIPPRYRPRLENKPLTQALPYKMKKRFSLAHKPEYASALDSKNMPSDLSDGFDNWGIAFQDKSLSIQGEVDSWSLSDGVKAYRVRLEGQLLVIYQLPPTANTVAAWNARAARPAVRLFNPSKSDPDKKEWLPRATLLNSKPSAREFVAEIGADSTVFLRFGDDTFGRRPESGDTFEAEYRVGNGMAGNVGVNVIQHIVSNESDGILKVWNPLPASGGEGPESIERVRQLAPYVYRKQERAVTPQDYAKIAARHPQVQRAAAFVRWTGSWNTIFLVVDRLGGYTVDRAFKRILRRFLERYRMAGHDLEIQPARYIPLDIKMEVCVQADYFRSDVSQALLSLYSADDLPDGGRGVFHPDNFTFGQPVYLSQIYAVAQDVAGVDSYQITTFQRLGQPDDTAILDGKIRFSPLEVARLDNNPNYPEHGVFGLKLEGGR
jgi:hypothetical protein